MNGKARMMPGHRPQYNRILAMGKPIRSHTFPPLSVARYSFIQLSELKQGGANETAQALKRPQDDSNSVLSIACPMS